MSRRKLLLLDKMDNLRMRRIGARSLRAASQNGIFRADGCILLAYSRLIFCEHQPGVESSNGHDFGRDCKGHLVESKRTKVVLEQSVLVFTHIEGIPFNSEIVTGACMYTQILDDRVLRDLVCPAGLICKVHPDKLGNISDQSTVGLPLDSTRSSGSGAKSTFLILALRVNFH